MSAVNLAARWARIDQLGERGGADRSEPGGIDADVDHATMLSPPLVDVPVE